MPIAAFDHVNIRAADVDRTRDFYVRVLGLAAGPRPAFARAGYWLYLGDRPIVHLVQRDPGEAGGDGSGNLDHIAFRGVDLDATRDALEAARLPFREAVGPDGAIRLFVHDPDGIKLELSFIR